MNSYFEVGVRYDKTMEDGVIRKVTENYLLDALSFTEAEKRATEEMEVELIVHGSALSRNARPSPGTRGCGLPWVG